MSFAENNSFMVSESVDGIHTVLIDRYELFSNLLGRNSFLNYPEYVFRGHRDPSWRLLPSLYRIFNDRRPAGTISTEDSIRLKEEAGRKAAFLLKHFLLGLRGTEWYQEGAENLLNWFASREPHSTHINDLSSGAFQISGLREEALKIWAIGQHFGLKTPLLDWTKSLFAAFYFAFYKPDNRSEGEESRAVYAINRRLIQERSARYGTGIRLEFIAPYLRDNARMIAQQSLFSYSPVSESIEEWVAKHFEGENKPVLIKFLIRNVNTSEAIRWPSRAGVSDRTMFPDLKGIAKFSNRTIEDYELDY